MYKRHIQGRLMGEKLGLWFQPYKCESLWRLMGGNLVYGLNNTRAKALGA